MQPSPTSVYKSLCPPCLCGEVGVVSLWTDVCYPPLQLLAPEIKQAFFSTDLAFEQRAAGHHTHSFSNNMAIFNISPKSFCKIDIQWSYTIFFQPYNPFKCTVIYTIWKSTLCGILLKIYSYSSEYKVLQPRLSFFSISHHLELLNFIGTSRRLAHYDM